MKSLFTEGQRRALREATLPKKWPRDVYLHGSPKKTLFRKPDAGNAIFFSDPNDHRRRGPMTQAEYYARASHRGWLAAVKLKPGKFFDTFSDPVAKKIRQEHAPLSVRSWPNGGSVDWRDAAKVLKAAKPHGYNHFEFFESQSFGYSEAVTDPTLIDVIEWYKVETR